VTFLGEQPHDVVAAELRGARAFVQHSITAVDGDSEGLPNSVLEASATGIPVVSTRHAGIPEIVVDGTTGYLVDEHDVPAMVTQMERLLGDPALAATLGRAGRRARGRRGAPLAQSTGLVQRCSIAVLPRPPSTATGRPASTPCSTSNTAALSIPSCR
jgi:Glycosyl transferases group 1